MGWDDPCDPDDPSYSSGLFELLGVVGEKGVEGSFFFLKNFGEELLDIAVASGLGRSL